MPKPGVITLPINIFPKLQEKYTKTELKHMLLLCGIDVNDSGLQVFQTVPQLLERNEVITTKEVAYLIYPIVRTAITKEFVHAKFICLLNTSSGGEKMDYMVTAVFIGDNKNENIKLADLYLGEPDNGTWADEEQVKRFAESMNVKYYTRDSVS